MDCELPNSKAFFSEKRPPYQFGPVQNNDGFTLALTSGCICPLSVANTEDCIFTLYEGNLENMTTLPSPGYANYNPLPTLIISPSDPEEGGRSWPSSASLGSTWDTRFSGQRRHVKFSSLRSYSIYTAKYTGRFCVPHEQNFSVALKLNFKDSF